MPWWQRMSRKLSPPQVSQIFLFHRLSPSLEDDHPLELIANTQAFETWLGDLLETVQVCFVDDMLEQGYPKVEQANKVAITFDDGYADNFTELLPICERHRVPVSIFLNSDWVDNGKRRLGDRILRLVELGRIEPKSACSTAWRLHQLNAAEQENLLVARWNYPIEEEVQLGHGALGLNSEHIKTMADSGWIRFESHGHQHLSYAQLCPNEIEDDIALNIEAITGWTGRRPKVFAYPFGQEQNLNPETAQICRRLGLGHALMASGRRQNKWCDPHRIDRREPTLPPNSPTSKTNP
jgi:peptidoglycan/xylan/chitin deacetylase (PgdA/CDA1 family)